MIDLQPHEITELQNRIKADIHNYSVQTLMGEHRTHLGASVIGHACSRHIWYAFHWVRFEVFGGRMLRLFERGNLEEPRFIKILEGIGFKVWSVDANGKQFRITGANGHYGGSADSVGKFPNYPQYNGFNEPILLEFKTHNRGSFAKLLKEGVIISKPRHYAQMCAYGVEFGFRYCLYMAVNKDDDDIHLEIVLLDPRYADDLSRKAEDIIASRVPPVKISLQPEFFECKFCAFSGICHRGQAIEKNCRSCVHAWPIENAQWGCDHWKQIIPPDFIPQGCNDWKGIV